MNCPKCNTKLEENSNICPNCGEVVSLEDELEILETLTVEENMVPPSLEVDKENLTEGVKDMNSVEDTVYESVPEENIVNVIPEKKDDIQFDIPSVSNVVENADQVTGVVSESDKKAKKKITINLKGSLPTTYVLISGLFLLIVGLLLGKSLFSTNICISTNRPSNINSNVVADGKNNETYVDGYKYKIPQKYLYDKINNGLLIYDNDGNIRIFIKIYSGSYQNIAVSKTSVKETLKENNVSVNSIEEKSLSDEGETYVIIEATTSNQNRLLAFRKLDDEHVYYIEVIDITNNYNTEALKVADDVINNVLKKEGATVEKTSIYDFSEVIITAANEYKALISN